jgi:hypothetical protein
VQDFAQVNRPPQARDTAAKQAAAASSSLEPSEACDLALRDARTFDDLNKTHENRATARIRAALFAVSFLGFSPNQGLTLG